MLSFPASILTNDHAGSNLGLWSVGVSPHRAVIGAADRTVNTVIIKYSNTLLALVGCKEKQLLISFNSAHFLTFDGAGRYITPICS